MSAELGGRAITAVAVSHAVDVDVRTGAASIRIEVPCTPGRMGFGPALALMYSGTGAGSPFGLGWSLSGWPAIGIDVRRRAPRYDGSDDLQFGGDEIVAQLEKVNDAWSPRRRIDGDWQIAVYRSRRNGRKTRIERWSDARTGRVHFRTRDASGVLTIYGARPGAAARIAEPDDEARTFSWLPELQLDRCGNAIWFEYAAETNAGVDRAAPFEPRAASAQRYLKRIRYSNATPLAITDELLAGDAGTIRWHMQLVLDYGDHSGDAPSSEPDRPWLARQDPSTTHRPGFAVRTHRLCRRFAWFHEFDELGAGPTLVGALALEHDERTDGAMLRSVREHGYRRELTGITTRAVPPLRLRYAPVEPERAFQSVPRETLESFSATPGSHRFVDLFGEGLPGILTETAGAWLYKTNLGDGRFGAATLVAEKPSVRPETFAFGDLDGNGDLELSQLGGRLAGRFELPREDARWRGFAPFAAFPHVEALGGRAQWVDLNGDGRPDIVIAGSDRLIWFPSAGDEFDAPIEVPLPSGASAAPTATADPALHLFFADMTGDGLPDLVRVENGSVTYWPTLGNGRFADVVVMEGAAAFTDGDFDPGRVRFVDLDGTGTTDLVYLGNGEVTCWINAAGNRLQRGPRLGGLPRLDNLSTVSVVDFLGDGRPCLVWTNPIPGHDAIEYLPLTTAIRPRMLVEIDDTRGKVTRLSYASAAAHYLRDRMSAAPWRTRLPDHPIVVDRLEVIDEIGGCRSVRRYAYHDGYFDGEERELRGFGRVDVYDSEPAEGGESAPSFSTPSLTRTWFHLGTPMWNHHRPDETYGGDLHVLPPHTIDNAEPFGAGDLDDGLRTLAGQVIRTELWSLTDGKQGEHPIHVQQRTLQLSLAQPRSGAARAVFEALGVEDVTEVYEQEGGDPRVTHELVLVVDAFGTPTRTASIAYPRRSVQAGLPAAQSQKRIVIEDRRVLSIDRDDRFELDIPIDARRFELIGVGEATGDLIARARLLEIDIGEALAAAAPHHVELVDVGSPKARILSHEQSYYWNTSRTDALALGDVSAPTLIHHEEAACFARAQIAELFGARANDSRLASLGYIERDATWWKREARQEFSGAADFYQRVASIAEDGARAEVEYDAYSIAARTAVDAVGNRTISTVDYHTLLPRRMEDPNGTIVEAERDPLGVIVAITQRGNVSDNAWGFAPLSSAAPITREEILADPAAYVGGVARRVWYDTDAWARDRAPNSVVTVVREQLLDDGQGVNVPSGSVATGVAYLDGFGRTLQTKVRVEPGLAIQRDAQGSVVVDSGGQPVLVDTTDRWLASGHVVYDTQQRAGRAYEPYFSPSSEFEGDDVLRTFGVSTLKRFDALGRLVSIDLPNGSFSKATYRAWEVENADPNDTVDESTYRALRESLPSSAPERQALDHARRHANTTRVTYLDPAGRECGSLSRGEPGTADRRIELRLDVQGAQRAVVDPRGLVAYRYHHDMEGRPLHEQSVDAGPLWTLPDARDRAAWTWNARDVEVERGFDLAGRPTFVHVRGGDGSTPLDHRVEEHLYGEGLPDRADAIRRNLLGRATAVRDASGEATVEHYDPAGRPLLAHRRLLDDDGREIDWRTPPAFAAGTFTVSRSFDGLGRPRGDTLPDGTRRRFEYRSSGLIARVLVTTPDGTFTDLPVLEHADVNARGQRIALRLGNGIDIAYAYDRDTRRLEQHTVRRGTRRLRDEHYTYDPVGNLVRIDDPSQEGPEAIIKNATLGARRDYTYDAHYRLRSATGRVHQALLQHDYVPGAAGAVKQSRHLSLNNGAALERYTRTYDLDTSGNLTAIRHVGTSQSWTTSLWIDPVSNRSLPAIDHTGTTVANPASQFDPAGNVRQLDHLRDLTWGWRNTLHRAVLIARPGGTDDAERYVYGADGQRVRKVSTRVVHGDVELTEKLYFGDQELLRITRNGAPILERWTTHVSDGGQRLALIHRWTRDDLARETDDVTRARIRYQIEDRQRSATLELDNAGQIISYEEHFPYGGTSLIAGDSIREVSLKEYRYSGKERDDVTGLYYYGHRYYAPWMGRWLSPDPIGPGDDLNLYQFVRGDPVGNTDPSGLDTNAKHKPGEIVYINRVPPAPATSVEGKVAAYRASRGKAARAGFDTLSSDDRIRIATQPGLAMVPSNPRAPTAGQTWTLLSRADYEATWLPARQAWAVKQGKYLKVGLSSENPNASVLGSAGISDTADPKENAAANAPPATQAKAGDASKGNATEGANTGSATEDADKGDGTGDGTGTENGDGDEAIEGGGSGTGTSGASGSGGTGTHGTGTGPDSESKIFGTEKSSTYGGFGGQRGGADNGVLGGARFSAGTVQGGIGATLEIASRKGTATSGSPAGAGGAQPHSAEGGTSAGSPRGPLTGAGPSQGLGPGGAKQGEDGSSRPRGWKDLVLDVSAILSFTPPTTKPGGSDQGIPGALGWLNLDGSAVQSAFIATSIVGFAAVCVLGLGKILEGLSKILEGMLYALRRFWFALTALPRLLRLGGRALRRAARGAWAPFDRARSYLSGRSYSSGFTNTPSAVMDAFRNAQHTGLSQRVLAALDSGTLKLSLNPLLKTSGRILTAMKDVLEVKADMSMPDMLNAIVHEGQHAFDLSTGRIPETVTSASGLAYAEFRAFLSELAFSKLNGFGEAGIAKFHDQLAHRLFEGVIESYKLGGRIIGNSIGDKEAMSIIARVLEEMKND